MSYVCKPHIPPHFNPRSHEGSDVFPPATLFVSFQISTHAPTRGATDLAEYIAKPIEISTHAPTRGATARRNFLHRLKKISTHAPTRGATKAEAVQDINVVYFNPRSHEGSDGKSRVSGCGNRILFQPTLPRGERRGSEED